MGIYESGCVQCGKPFMWFSGNPDHRCQECAQHNAFLGQSLEVIVRGLALRIKELETKVEALERSKNGLQE